MAYQANYLSQRDPRWRDAKLGFDEEVTIGTGGYTLTCLTMLVNGYGYSETPQTLNEKLIDLGPGNGFIGPLAVWAGLSQLFPRIQYRKIILCPDHDAPLADIDAALARGQAVLVEVDRPLAQGLENHWVVLYAKQGDDYLMTDPWPYPPDKKDTLLTSRYGLGLPIEKTITAVVWYECQDTDSSPAQPPETTEPDLYVRVMTVQSLGLSLRSKPTTESETLSIEPPGNLLYVLESKGVAQRKIGVPDQWLRVRDPLGTEGYVAAWYVEAINQDSPTAGPESQLLTIAAPDPKALIDSVNDLRVINGLPAFKISATLLSIAQDHAIYMASNGNLSHLSADGSRPFQRALAAGYPLAGDLTQGGFMSEDIAGGSAMSVDQALAHWQSSDPHFNTIISTKYRLEVGAGVAVSGNRIYFCLNVALPTTVTSVSSPDDQETELLPETELESKQTPELESESEQTPKHEPVTEPIPETEPETVPIHDALTLKVYVTPRVGANGLRVRSKPSMAGAPVTVLEAGTEMTVLENADVALAKIGRPGDWLHVKDVNGNTGYAAAWLVVEALAPVPPHDLRPQIEPEPEPSTESMMVIVSQLVGPSGLRMRSEPGLDGSLVTVEPASTRLTVLEDATEARAKLGVVNAWINVLDQQGYTGYVAAWYVHEEGDTPGTPGDVPIEVIPEEEAELLTVFVSLSARKGLYLRSGPSSDAEIIKVIPPNSQITVLDPPHTATERVGVYNQWLNVQDIEGDIGYVAACYLHQ